jgi:parallel beta-helix repeat protein
LTGNEISHSSIGIEVKKSDPLIMDNDIKWTNISGIEVTSESNPEITDNNLTENLQSGITVQEGATPLITGNLFNFNLYGMTIRGADIDIQDNSFKYNDFAILCEDGADSVFFNNTFLESTFFDFALKRDSHPIVQSSPFNKSHVAADVTSSLLVQWRAEFVVVNSKEVPLKDASVTFYDNGDNVGYYDKTEFGGVLPPFKITEAEIGYDGIRDYGPYRVDIQWEDERNETLLAADRDYDDLLYLNFRPILTLEDIAVIEEVEDVIDLTSTLSDGDGNVEDITITTDSDHIKVDNITKQITLYYEEEINYEIVTFNVSDGISTESYNVIITVIPINDRPTFNGPIPNFEVYEDVGWSLNLSQYFDDEENPEGLLFNCSHPEIIIDNTSKHAIWKAADTQESLKNVIITAMDNGNMYAISNAFTLTLIPVNDRPVYVGGLKNATVREDTRWEISLLDYFIDEEDRAGLTYSASDPRIKMDPKNRTASWSPVEGDVSIVGLTFTAHDAEDPELSVTSEPISLVFEPVDDPPMFLKACMEDVPDTIYSGQKWQIVLSDCFHDEEHDLLEFDSNYRSKFEIVNDSLGRVKAVWEPKDHGTDIEVKDLVFFATQVSGESKGRRAKSDPINITFKTNQTQGPVEPEIRYLPSEIPWYVYASIPVAIFLTALVFFAYRRLRYHKYEIQDIFLVFNDGRLVTHMTGGGEVSDMDQDILASMLTAIQDFVKESLASREVSSLDEMKYGGMNILIERGIFAYLSVVISGNVTNKLKDEMKETLRNVERKYATILEGWDGDNKKLADLEDELNMLIDGQPKNALDLLRSY